MDHGTLERARAAFAALDLEHENSEIARIEAEMASIAQAAERAQTRIAEVSRALAESRGPSGHDVADQLLQGADAREAAAAGPSREDLESERAALQAATRDLRRREDDLRAAVSAVETTAAQQAADLAGPLLSAIEADMIEAVSRIRHGWAAASAVRAAARSGGPLVDKARRMLEAASSGDALLSFERIVAVDPEIVAALAPLTTKGRALRSSAITSATFI